MASKYANNGTLPANLRLNQLRYDAKKRYGLELEEARRLRSGACEICGLTAKKMVIDHAIPGTYRGVLCQQCNVRLGWLERLAPKINDYIAYAVKRRAGK